MSNEVGKRGNRYSLFDILTGAVTAAQSPENEPQKSTVNVNPFATPVQYNEESCLTKD
jgi:hypothetical protein